MFPLSLQKNIERSPMILHVFPSRSQCTICSHQLEIIQSKKNKKNPPTAYKHNLPSRRSLAHSVQLLSLYPLSHVSVWLCKNRSVRQPMLCSAPFGMTDASVQIPSSRLWVYLLLDELPDDPGHLVSVHLHHWLGHLDAFVGICINTNTKHIQ